MNAITIIKSNVVLRFVLE